MPDVHLPHLEEEHDDEAAPPAAPAPHRRWPLLKIALEVLLITTGVFLGLAGEQWRQGREHREQAHASLERFRAEFRGNRGEVMRVHDRHVGQLRDMVAYLNGHQRELMAHLADPRQPLPPIPDVVTDHPAFDYSAWDLALTTQSLAYIDPGLVADISAVYREQQVYDDAHRSISAAAYSILNDTQYLKGVTAWFGDVTMYEDQLLKRYDALLPRLDAAIAR